MGIQIKTSGDFENDPEGAIDALEKTGFAIFMITDKWFSDKRAQKEWRFAKDVKKPMLYLFTDPEKLVVKHDLTNLMEVPTLIGTINYYGDMKKTGMYIQAIIAAFKEIHKDEIR